MAARAVILRLIDSGTTRGFERSVLQSLYGARRHWSSTRAVSGIAGNQVVGGSAGAQWDSAAHHSDIHPAPDQ